MTPSWFIAKRFFTAQRGGFLSFITTFAIIGVTLGTAALIITLSVLDGFEKEIKEKVVGFTAHIQTQGFQNKPLLNYQESVEIVKKELPEICTIVPFVAREAIIRVNENVDGIFLKGIDIDNDISLVRTFLTEGRYLSKTATNLREIILGKNLARRLNAKLGDKVIVFSLSMDKLFIPHPRVMQFQIVGLYESGMAEYDNVYVYTNLENTQRLFQMQNGVSGFDILVHDLQKVDYAARRIDDLLGYPHYSRTVLQTYRNLFAWIDLQKKFSPIILALIIVVATVNIIGTLLMFVLEKLKEIAIIRSMGMSRSGVQKIFIVQGLLIAIIGIVIGNVLAFILCWIQLKYKLMSLPSEVYYMLHVPMLLRWENFVIVSIVTLVLCLLTTIIPSRAAAKIDPITALRFG